MGYPMTYSRVVHRNTLRGDYGRPDTKGGHLSPQRDSTMIAGDLRRLETDSRDASGLAYYAEKAGITAEQVRVVFDAFFGDFPYDPTKDWALNEARARATREP